MPTYSGPQGASHVPGVILFSHASDCTVRNCTVSACAWYGIHAAEERPDDVHGILGAREDTVVVLKNQGNAGLFEPAPGIFLGKVVQKALHEPFSARVSI